MGRDFLIASPTRIPINHVISSGRGRLRVSRKLTRKEFIELARTGEYSFGPTALTNKTQPEADHYYTAERVEEP